MSREYLEGKEGVPTNGIEHITVFYDKETAILIFVFVPGWSFDEVNRAFDVTEQLIKAGNKVQRTFLDMTGAGMPNFGAIFTQTEKKAKEKDQNNMLLPIGVLGSPAGIKHLIRVVQYSGFLGLNVQNVNSYEEYAGTAKSGV